MLGQPRPPPTRGRSDRSRVTRCTIDYGSNSMRVEQVLTMPTPHRAAVARRSLANSARCSSSEVHSRGTKPPAAGAQTPTVQPQPAAAASGCYGCGPPRRRASMKAAASNARVRNVANGAELTFTVGGRYPIVASINKMNQVERVTRAPAQRRARRHAGRHHLLGV